MISKKTVFCLINMVIIGLFSGCEEDNVFSVYQGNQELMEGDSVPFLLYQNYPNPFNPSTRIEYRVGIPLNLKLTVYSDEWQPERVLVDKSTNPGQYIVEFHTDSDELPSGDYYYTLEGGGYIQIRKMKLVK